MKDLKHQSSKNLEESRINDEGRIIIRFKDPHDPEKP